MRERSMSKKRKKLPFYAFRLNAGTYDYDFWVVVSEDTDRVQEWFRKKFDPTFKHNFGQGFVAQFKDYTPVLWIPRFPKTPREYGTLSHEIFHMTEKIMVWSGVVLTEHSEEAYCHLIAYITRNILERFDLTKI